MLWPLNSLWRPGEVLALALARCRSGLLRVAGLRADGRCRGWSLYRRRLAARCPDPPVLAVRGEENKCLIFPPLFPNFPPWTFELVPSVLPAGGRWFSLPCGHVCSHGWRFVVVELRCPVSCCSHAAPLALWPPDHGGGSPQPPPPSMLFLCQPGVCHASWRPWVPSVGDGISRPTRGTGRSSLRAGRCPRRGARECGCCFSLAPAPWDRASSLRGAPSTRRCSGVMLMGLLLSVSGLSMELEDIAKLKSKCRPHPHPPAGLGATSDHPVPRSDPASPGGGHRCRGAAWRGQRRHQAGEVRDQELTP